jgi:hypothetical protein
MRVNTAITAFALLLALPVAGPAAEFTDLLSGKTCPLTVRLGDLTKDWRRFTLRAAGAANGNVSISVSVSGTRGSPSNSSQNNIADFAGNRVYLTTGQTVSVNDQVYLVAYHVPGAGLDIPTLLQAAATKSLPTAGVLTPGSVLPLTLLDVKSIGSLEDIRVFDMQYEIAESEKLASAMAAVVKAISNSSTNSAASSRDQPGK